jgi:hypothetical protein
MLATQPESGALFSVRAAELLGMRRFPVGDGFEKILLFYFPFANTYGGFLIVGAKANSSDGRLRELPGVARENSYKQKIVSWCTDGASPPLTVEVSDAIPRATNREAVCYVIYVPESDSAPHFLNGRKGAWVRVDEFSKRVEDKLAEEDEIRQLLDRRRRSDGLRSSTGRRCVLPAGCLRGQLARA